MNIGWIGFLQILAGAWLGYLISSVVVALLLVIADEEIKGIGLFKVNWILCGGLIGFLLI